MTILSSPIQSNPVSNPIVRDHNTYKCIERQGEALMLSTSKMYSKGRKGTNKAGAFDGDSEKKEGNLALRLFCDGLVSTHQVRGRLEEKVFHGRFPTPLVLSRCA